MMPSAFQRALSVVAAGLLGAILADGAALAQTAGCGYGDVNNGSLLHYAAATPTERPPVDWGSVRISYFGHSSFLIETPGGASAFTDFTGIHKPPFVPDVVTMNNANTGYAADYMEGRGERVLRGWDPSGGIAQHDVKFKDMRVSSLPTNLVNGMGGESNGNSIFIFESAGLCIAHLGNIQHILTDDDRRALNRVDVLMLPIDGDENLSHAEVMMIIDQAMPKLVLPMSLNLPGPAKAFRSLVDKFYPVKDRKGQPLVVSRSTLPASTEVVFMEP
jgi:L-ascorbate metabolism protein UlaG (beta-lactamase superfamily)